MSFTAAIPSTGEKVDLTFSGSTTPSVSDYMVTADNAAIELNSVTGSGTAWSLLLQRTRNRWVPSGQTVKVTSISGSETHTATNSSTRTLAQDRYIGREFGIFVHLSSSTWGTSGAVTLPYIEAIDMTSYDMEQWFTSVIVPSGARYAVLTTKHDGGFCLWPSTAGSWNISQTAFGAAHPGADLVRDWVRLCRKYNMGVGLYINFYDPWFKTSRPGATGAYTNPDYTTYMTQQITELFSNYGKIDMFWIDSLAYDPAIGYGVFPWANMVALRDSLQPACLLINNDHVSDLSHSDIAVSEGSGVGGSIPPSSNTVPLEYTEDSRTNNAWIWEPFTSDTYQDVYAVAAKVAQARTARTAYLLNFPVNRSGLEPTSSGTYAAQLGGIIGKQGATPVVPALLDVRYGIDRGDGQPGIWGGGINGSAILGVA